ncbi:MAG: hypothetical protein WA857_05115 [Candidatus Acidiferrum sp.]
MTTNPNSPSPGPPPLVFTVALLVVGLFGAGGSFAWQECRIYFSWDAITALGTVGLAVIAGLALRYAKQQIADFRAESRVQHLNDLERQFRTEPLASSRKNLANSRLLGGKRLDPSDPPAELRDLLNFFEHVGWLLHNQVLNFEDVYVEFHFWILHIFADARELIEKENKESPIYYKYLKEMQRRLTERREQDGPVKIAIKEFYQEEARLSGSSPIPRGFRVLPESQTQGVSRFGWEEQDQFPMGGAAPSAKSTRRPDRT